MSRLYLLMIRFRCTYMKFCPGVVPQCPSISIENRSAISAAVSWIIIVTAAPSSAFRYFTGKTLW